MTFLRIVIPLYLFVEHDLRANAFVARENRFPPSDQVRGHAFPDHALAHPIARGHHPVTPATFWPAMFSFAARPSSAPSSGAPPSLAEPWCGLGNRLAPCWQRARKSSIDSCRAPPRACRPD